jgi:putative endonuclease
LYTGVTNDVARRLGEHRDGHSAFTRKYRIHRLLHVETTSDIHEALAREKQIKGWTRAKKLKLIRMQNPRLLDLLADSPRSDTRYSRSDDYKFGLQLAVAAGSRSRSTRNLLAPTGPSFVRTTTLKRAAAMVTGNAVVAVGREAD